MIDGYRNSIYLGAETAERFVSQLTLDARSFQERIEKLAEFLDEAENVVVGAGAGLSCAAGFLCSGERFAKYFSDFANAFGIKDMYTGGFYPFPDEETRWAWWSRHIYFNRYVPIPKPEVFQNLFSLIWKKNYFIVTTNVDHLFQKSGFDKKRLFYTQGDYGLFQSVNPKIGKTFDNEEIVVEMMKAQGFVRDENDENKIFQPPKDGRLVMRIPTDLVPKTPDDGSPMTLNLRSDDSFVEDDGWRQAANAYAQFLDSCAKGKTLYLELGVGGNTPGVVKFPFWRFAYDNSDARYATINLHEAYCPRSILSRSVCLDADIATALDLVQKITISK